MNRRRMMMLQQSKGFELVYDAASGKLPQECGFYQTGGSLNITGDGLMMTGNGATARCEIGAYPNKSNLNSSMEIEITPVTSYFSFHIRTPQTYINYYVTTDKAWGRVKPYSVHVSNVFENFVKIVSYPKNSRLRLRLDVEGHRTTAFLNDELLYSGEYIELYSGTSSRHYITTEGQTIVYRITYKEW